MHWPFPGTPFLAPALHDTTPSATGEAVPLLQDSHRFCAAMYSTSMSHAAWAPPYCMDTTWLIRTLQLRLAAHLAKS